MSSKFRWTRIAAMLAFMATAAGNWPAATASEEAASGAAAIAPRVASLEAALRESGVDPIEFTLSALEEVDLVLFDDGLHPAVEPFEFYQRLVRDPRFARTVRHVFLEVVPMNQQEALDRYFASDPEDRSLLYPAFQHDYSGTGWALQTYFDLLHAVWDVNRTLPEADRLRVIGVASPCSWDCLQSPRDVELFRESLEACDYQMYLNIRRHLDGFSSGRKGIFLTNTRHAYTGVRRRDGAFYWNCGTFFRQWHPGRTLSVRCHAPQLAILAVRDLPEGAPRTAEGMERIEARWIRVEDGRWDLAFARCGDRPVAIRLPGTPFGTTRYVGNHMLDVAVGTTMADAYDALVYLAPIERWRRTALATELYTPEFRRELERRYRILYTADQLAEGMHEAGAATLSELIDASIADRSETVLPQSAGLPPLTDLE